MQCGNYGAENREEAKFCKKSGGPLPPDMETPVTVTENDTVPSETPPEKQTGTKRCGKKIFLMAAVILLAACVILAFVFTGVTNANRYDRAAALMNAGEFMQAKDEFTKLSAYKDSAAQAENCQKISDFIAAAKLMEAGKYDEAKHAFEALGDYTGAREKAQECQNAIDYHAALSLLNEGKLQEALAAFNKLGSFSDAAAKANECQLSLDYEVAKALMDQGDISGARSAFSALGGFKDSAQMAQNCQSSIDYAAADAAFQQGNYYTAFVLFSSLGSYNDSAARAESCKQHSATGELYRNPAFASKACQIMIKTPDDGYSTYIKIYSGNNLVSEVYSTSGKQMNVKLPSGTYDIRIAYGKNWFGTDEMFGDDGVYKVLVFDNNGTQTPGITFSSNYIYSLSLRQDDGGNAGAQTVGRGSF